MIDALLAPSGLMVRGSLNFGPNEAVPVGPTGKPAKAVVLVGSAGAKFWPHFQRWRGSQPDDMTDPLDSWSRMVIGTIALEVDARAVSPSDRPYLPFQQWAMRAQGLKPSPLGILMHPAYGLWHAYRGGLLFEDALDVPPVREPNHLCDLCSGKPCLNACPAGAHSLVGFDHPACLDHVRGAGETCRTGGCLDRNACPHGTAWRYTAEMQAFHMRAFAP